MPTVHGGAHACTLAARTVARASLHARSARNLRNSRTCKSAGGRDVAYPPRELQIYQTVHFHGRMFVHALLRSCAQHSTAQYSTRTLLRELPKRGKHRDHGYSTAGTRTCCMPGHLSLQGNFFFSHSRLSRGSMVSLPRSQPGPLNVSQTHKFLPHAEHGTWDSCSSQCTCRRPQVAQVAAGCMCPSTCNIITVMYQSVLWPSPVSVV